jgi:hypothetical protein
LLRQNPANYAEKYVKPYVLSDFDSLAHYVFEELGKSRAVNPITLSANLNKAAEARLNAVRARTPVHPLLNVKNFSGTAVNAYLGYIIEDEVDAAGIVYQILRENYLLAQEKDIDMPILSAEITDMGVYQVAKDNGCMLTAFEFIGRPKQFNRPEVMPGIGAQYYKPKIKRMSDYDCPPSALITKKKPKKRKD